MFVKMKNILVALDLIQLKSSGNDCDMYVKLKKKKMNLNSVVIPNPNPICNPIQGFVT